MNTGISFENNPNRCIIPHICYFKSPIYPSHWQNAIEILCCFEGKTTVYMDSHSVVMEAGDTVVVNYRQIHSFTSDSPASWYCLILTDKFFEMCKLDIKKIRFENKFKDEFLYETLKKLCTIYDEKPNDFYWAEINRLAFDYYIHLHKNHQAEPSPENSVTLKKHNLVIKALEYIDTHYSSKITVDEIADYVKYSRYYFVRIFKEYTGMSVLTAINIKRTEQALELLRSSDLTINTISAKCGFENPSYFSKVFKNLQGCYPSEVRK